AATSKSAAKFDPAELASLNRALVHAMPFAEVEARLAALGIEGQDAETFWLAVCGNLDRVADAAIWWRIARDGPLEKPQFSPEDAAFVSSAFELLPEEPWNGETWKVWTQRVKEATGRKGRALFMPLRLALTGREQGPELADLLPLLSQ